MKVKKYRPFKQGVRSHGTEKGTYFIIQDKMFTMRYLWSLDSYCETEVSKRLWFLVEMSIEIIEWRRSHIKKKYEEEEVIVTNYVGGNICERMDR